MLLLSAINIEYKTVANILYPVLFLFFFLVFNKKMQTVNLFYKYKNSTQKYRGYTTPYKSMCYIIFCQKIYIVFTV